jgi:DNA-binding response OmpR family regulator
MRYRVLIVGIDVDLLEIRQVLLNSWGYASLIATPEDVDEKLQSGRFDLVVLSLMLGQEVKRQVQDKLPAGTRPLLLGTLVWPVELRRTVAEALGRMAPQ